jgi:hypothetical protein
VLIVCCPIYKKDWKYKKNKRCEIIVRKGEIGKNSKGIKKE